MRLLYGFYSQLCGCNVYAPAVANDLYRLEGLL